MEIAAKERKDRKKNGLGGSQYDPKKALSSTKTTVCGKLPFSFELHFHLSDSIFVFFALFCGYLISCAATPHAISDL
jgi:hypothetical protein